MSASVCLCVCGAAPITQQTTTKTERVRERERKKRVALSRSIRVALIVRKWEKEIKERKKKVLHKKKLRMFWVKIFFNGKFIVVFLGV